MLQGEHSAILSTFIKLPYVFKTFVLSVIEWPLKAGFTVDYLIRRLLYIKIDFNWSCDFQEKMFENINERSKINLNFSTYIYE